MDTAQWHQEMGGLQVKPMEEPAVSSSSSSSRVMAERRARPQKEQALNCPRCNSTNTKFCYYNNYSLTQPRYFCKACRRYWTQGGSLRNVPVGGGSRKNKRSSSSSNPSSFTPSATTSAAAATAAAAPTLSSQNPRFHEGQDLNLAYPEFGDFSRVDSGGRGGNPSMEFLRSGISGRGLGPFMQMSMPDEGAVYPSGFGLQQPTLSFPIDGIGGGGGGGGYGMHEGGGRLLFPFEDLKPVPSSTPEFEQSRGQGGDPPGFWNGMIGGGPW